MREVKHTTLSGHLPLGNMRTVLGRPPGLPLQLWVGVISSGRASPSCHCGLGVGTAVVVVVIPIAVIINPTGHAGGAGGLRRVSTIIVVVGHTVGVGVRMVVRVMRWSRMVALNLHKEIRLTQYRG